MLKSRSRNTAARHAGVGVCTDMRVDMHARMWVGTWAQIDVDDGGGTPGDEDAVRSERGLAYAL